MGSKGGGQMTPMVMNVGQSQQQSTTQADPYAAGLYKDILGRANALTQQGFNPYTGQRVAGFTPDQLAAFQGVRGLQGQAQDLYSQATGAAQNVLGGLNPMNFAQNVQGYMSPYLRNVVDAATRNMAETNAQQMNQLQSQAIKSGAYGGDRAAVARAEMARQQNLANQQSIANLLQSGYTTAQDQANKMAQMGLTGATTLGGLASQGQQAALQGLQSLLGIGGQQQMQQQQGLDVAYQNYLQQQAYPYQQLSWLGGLAGGLAPNLGGTSSSSGTTVDQRYQAAPSLGSQVMGGITTGLGLAAPFIGNALLPGLGSAIGAGLGALGGPSPFPSRGYGASYADGGMVDGYADQEIMQRNEMVPDYNLNPYPEDAVDYSSYGSQPPAMKADGGSLGLGGLKDGLIFEKIMGGTPYGGMTSYISPELIAMNKPTHFRAPQLQEMKHNFEAAELEQRPQGLVGNFMKGLGAAIKGSQKQASSEDREHAAYGGSFQTGYAPRYQVPQYGGFGGFGKGMGFNPMMMPNYGGAYRQEANQSDDRMVANPSGGPDIPASQLGFITGANPAAQTAPTGGQQQQIQTGGFGGFGKGIGFDPRFIRMGQNFPNPNPNIAAQGYPMSPMFGGYGGFGGLNPYQTAPRPAGGGIPTPQTMEKWQQSSQQPVYARGGEVREGYRNGYRVEDYLPALAMGETGGEEDPYSALGPVTKGGHRAHGKYQVMDYNIPQWAKEAGLGEKTPEQFLGNKEAQEKIAAYKFGQYLDKTQDPSKASAMWFGGPGYMKHPNAKDVLGTNISQYQNRFMRNLGQLKDSPMGLNAGKDVVAMDRDEDNVVATDQAPETPQGGFNITPEMQMGIISAGLGMLANRSPFMGVGVGEGGLKGVETYLNALSGKRQQQQLEQQRENIQSEIQQRAVETAMKQRQMQMLLDADKANRALFSSTPTVATDATAAPIVGQDEEGTGEIGAPTDLTGSGYAETGEPATPKPIVVAADESNKADIDPLWDPRRLALGVQINSVANPNLAKLYQERLSHIEQTGMVYDRQGRPIPLPGYLEKKAAETATTTTAQKAAEANYTYVDVQPEPGGPIYKVKQSELENFAKQHPEAQPINPGAGTPPGGELRLPKGAVASKQPEFYKDLQADIAKDERKMLEQFQVRQTMRERLDTMADILATYQPGKWAEQKASLISGLRSIGFPVSEENIRSAADFETFTKNSTINMFDQVKNLGGKILATEIEGMKQANPSASMQPESNRRILGQMRGLLDYEDKHFNDYSDWKKGNRNAYDTSDFERKWVKENRPKSFIEESTKAIGAKGVAIPPRDQLKVGDTYIINNVKRRWNGTGFEKVQ